MESGRRFDKRFCAFLLKHFHVEAVELFLSRCAGERVEAIALRTGLSTRTVSATTTGILDKIEAKMEEETLYPPREEMDVRLASMTEELEIYKRNVLAWRNLFYGAGKNCKVEIESLKRELKKTEESVVFRAIALGVTHEKELQKNTEEAEQRVGQVKEEYVKEITNKDIYIQELQGRIACMEKEIEDLAAANVGRDARDALLSSERQNLERELKKVKSELEHSQAALLRIQIPTRLAAEGLVMEESEDKRLITLLHGQLVTVGNEVAAREVEFRNLAKERDEAKEFILELRRYIAYIEETVEVHEKEIAVKDRRIRCLSDRILPARKRIRNLVEEFKHALAERDSAIEEREASYRLGVGAGIMEERYRGCNLEKPPREKVPSEKAYETIPAPESSLGKKIARTFTKIYLFTHGKGNGASN